jgi:predicted N-acetyltransferase YhbS
MWSPVNQWGHWKAGKHLVKNRQISVRRTRAGDLEIVDLCERSHDIGIVASWIYREFWSDKDGFSPVHFERLLSKACDPSAIPIALVATVGGTPAGTVSLIENDDEQRPYLRPWLAALYVAPEYRSQGIGSSLVNALRARADKLGESEIFLGTDNPIFYQRLGAVFFEAPRSGFFIMKLQRRQP